jgi:hypothetical protein
MMWIGPGWYGHPAAGTLHDDPPRPSATDAELVRQAYAVICPERTCRRCRCPLRTTVSIQAEPPRDGAWWTVQVRARCGAWRRHLNRAVASCDRDGIHLGAPGIGADRSGTVTDP